MRLMNGWKDRSRGTSPRRAFCLEQLEDRWMPAIVLDPAGTLTLTGTAGNDLIETRRNFFTTGTVARVNDEFANFAPGQVKAIVIKAGDGADVINVKSTEFGGVGVTVDAGTGDDEITVFLSGIFPDELIAGASVQAGEGNDRLR